MVNTLWDYPDSLMELPTYDLPNKYLHLSGVFQDLPRPNRSWMLGASKQPQSDSSSVWQAAGIPGHINYSI